MMKNQFMKANDCYMYKMLCLITMYGLVLAHIFIQFRGNLQAIETTSLQYVNGKEIDLSIYEKKMYSQNGEDGITEAIFKAIGTDSEYFVEFGVQDGVECNSRIVREMFRWKGLMMDSGFYNPSINLQKEFITAENINDLFAKYKVPYNLDLLSIDIDYNDFYVWKALDSKYKPRLVIIEYNAVHSPCVDKVVVYDSKDGWDGGSCYYGASIDALFKLGRKKGYSLVYAENRGVNLFFVRDVLLEYL
jgi:hypothetical protein